MSKSSRTVSIAILFFVISLLSGCGLNQEIRQNEVSTPTHQAIPTATREEDEEAIYRYVLNEYLSSSNALVVIKEYAKDTYFPEKTFDKLLTPNESVSQETIDDFIAQNEVSSPFAANMELGKKYIVLTKAEMDTIWTGGDQFGWQAFRKKYPGTYWVINLSRIGFNKTRTQALVYYSEEDGPKLGSGSACIFEKENGSWKLIDSVFSWTNFR